MTEEELKKTNLRLIEILGPECGLFGRVLTWQPGPKIYDYIGYVFSDDLIPTLKGMSPEKIKVLGMVTTYFEIHMRPLKRLLSLENKHDLEEFYSDMAWSHFSTLVMFGMLEIAIKGQRGVWLYSKGQRIKQFLENNLPAERKRDVAKRYRVDELFPPRKPITDFGSVVDHMWEEIRGGFVHDAGIQHHGMEWTTLEGLGSKENPIRINHHVPMQEWLQLTWQAILNSFGYKGVIELPLLKKDSR